MRPSTSMHENEVRAAAEAAGYVVHDKVVFYGFWTTYRLERDDKVEWVHFDRAGRFNAAHTSEGSSFAPSARKYSRRVGSREALDNFVRWLGLDDEGRRRFMWEARS